MKKRQRGQGLVEFALLLPVLLLVILGIVEAALVIQGFLAVQHAAREAARFAITYQPVQGACVDQDGDGQIADGIGADDDTDDYPAPYPDCPYGDLPNPAESDSAYYVRRTALIKQTARDAAVGLRIDDDHLSDFGYGAAGYEDDPGFFGVHVWGYPSFQTDCNADPNACYDHPGIEGLPVRVVVIHNVPVVDPFYQAIALYVPVEGSAQMINEGIQVGFSDEDLPDFDWNPHYTEPTVETPPEETPDGTPEGTPESTPVPTLVPSTYFVELNEEEVTNILPIDREHEFIATVTDDQGQQVQYARVSFSTDVGGFSYSGVDPKEAEELTDVLGQASVTLYGNRPGIATIQAWLDYDGDNLMDSGEPFDTATKIWVASGPYISVSDHEVIPLDNINIDVMDHDPISNPHTLLWCVSSVTSTDTSTVVQDPVNVDTDTGDVTDIVFEIPLNSVGLYRLETHSAGGNCGDGTDLVAYSADIEVIVALPDLHIDSFTLPDPICPQTLFTVSVTIENGSPTSINESFDVDFYLDPTYTPPQNPIGRVKQWVSSVGPNGTVVVNAVLWVESAGEYDIWARVDTTDYVEEENEDNNVDSVTFTTGSLSGDTENTGWRSPTNNYVGNIGFNNPANAHTNGGGYAYRNNNANNVSHVYRDYGFDIPADAIIEGVQVRLDWWLDSRWSSNSIRVYLSWDGGSSWTGYRTADTERTSDGNPTDIEGGAGYTWGRTWSPSEFSNSNFRVRLVLRTGSTSRDFRIDWVPVRVYYSLPPVCEMGSDPNPWPDPTDKPPGLEECQQLLRAGDFEGGGWVMSYWNAGGVNAYQRQSRYFYDGSQSMRLHASVGDYPTCPSLSPWLYQTVQIPTEVYTMTTMFVRGQRLVAGSLTGCSNPNSPDADDVLYLQMRDGGGADLGSPTTIVNGGATAESWSSFEEDVTSVVNPFDHPGEDVQVYFYATHDDDYDGTFFYLDALECEACTEWPVPDDEPGTASIGGDVRVLVGGIPQSLMGVDVWAYAQGGEVYHTTTIQDSTYHFYNIPPGTYVIYSETWVGGGLRTTMRSVTVGANERNYSVNLFLL